MARTFEGKEKWLTEDFGLDIIYFCITRRKSHVITRDAFT